MKHVLLVVLLLSIMTSCSPSNPSNRSNPSNSSNSTLTFKDLTQLASTDITLVEFRDGATGALYRTTDKEKIKAFWDFMNAYTYRKAKQPEPFAGFLYAGHLTSLNKETKIGFAMNMMSLEMYYNIVVENKTDYYNNLKGIVESFGKVPTVNGNIP